ncbi:MAG: hypothetical protein ACLUKN_06020 [Bacilli bacterium]
MPPHANKVSARKSKNKRLFARFAAGILRFEVPIWVVCVLGKQNKRLQCATKLYKIKAPHGSVAELI